MNKCLILMTSYNGEKYIRQQLDSICKQTFRDWTLLIRDDGSGDSTIEIIEEYMSSDDRIQLLKNGSAKHGAYLNFWTLIHYAKSIQPYEYYFFSDQDDVWLPEKLGYMISQAEEMKADYPLLLYGDMRVIDQDNKTIFESINSVMGIGEMKGYSLLFAHGYLWGCDICVNKKLLMSIPLPELDDTNIEILSHDNYMGKYALIVGKIKYLDRVLINYRRHGSNTTGVYDMKLSPLKIVRRALMQTNDLVRTHARVYNQTLLFIKEMKKTSIPIEGGEVLQKVEKLLRQGGPNSIKLLKNLGVKRKQFSRTIGIYLIILIGVYKKYLKA